MSFSISESTIPRDVQSDADTYSIEVTFVVIADTGDVVDEVDVRSFINNGGVANSIDGIPLFAVRSVKRINSLQYQAIVRYENTEPLMDEDSEIEEGPTITFDTSGGTQHISHGIKLIDSAGNKSPEIGAAINFDGQRVNGVDIVRPAFRFTQTMEIPDSQITAEYIGILRQFTGSVNKDLIGGFIIRSLLFLGATGSKTITLDEQEDIWTVTFNFASQEAEGTLDFGDFQITKTGGWDYLWVQYQDVEDDLQRQIVQKPIAVYIDQVYPEKDFAQLGVDLAF